MTSTDGARPPDRLPLSGDLTLIYGLSLAAALVMAVSSAAGILYPASLYPTEELRRSFMANDVVNLVVGLPILLGSMALARRGALIGLLFWPGALFYVVYNAVAYVFALPLNVAFLLALMLLTLTAYATIGLTACIDGEAVQLRLRGAVPESIAGAVLAGLGTVFFLRAIVIILLGITGSPPPPEDVPVLLSDALTAPATVIGGLLLWRRQPLGYVAGAGLLFQLSMLFVGLIAFMLLQPVLTAAPLALIDLVVVFMMGTICFVPLALFSRGIVRRT